MWNQSKNERYYLKNLESCRQQGSAMSAVQWLIYLKFAALLVTWENYELCSQISCSQYENRDVLGPKMKPNAAIFMTHSKRKIIVKTSVTEPFRDLPWQPAYKWQILLFSELTISLLLNTARDRVGYCFFFRRRGVSDISCYSRKILDYFQNTST